MYVYIYIYIYRYIHTHTHTLSLSLSHTHLHTHIYGAGTWRAERTRAFILGWRSSDDHRTSTPPRHCKSGRVNFTEKWRCQLD